ncbi:RILP-like protein homolog isoform X1 [Chironomus tepperi]|uniref:RILP-like protein homolog isoform X1 n=1 Tax=Chironomus tepperi TaxID=113505 RepID=UPI00391FB3F3
MLKLTSMSTINLSINDINELASEIGKECERLIATYGIDDINEIVSKCIIALQMLEKMSKENETANQEIYELHEKICALEKGTLEKVESQKAYEKEVESIEEIWNSEVEELRVRVKRLQEDNRKLLEIQGRSLERSLSKMSETSIDNITGSLYAEEYKMNIKLKEQVKKLEIEVKLKQNEIDAKDLEIRDLAEEIDELRTSQKQMRRQSRSMESQVKTLYEEREEILAEMHDQHKTFLILRDHLGMASLENDDLAFRKFNDTEQPRFSLNDVNSMIQERTQLMEKIDELEKELERIKNDHANGKFEDKLQKQIDQLLSSAKQSKELEVKAQVEEPKFKKLSFFDRLHKFVSQNRENYPNLYQKFDNDSIMTGPLYSTPI